MNETGDADVAAITIIDVTNDNKNIAKHIKPIAVEKIKQLFTDLSFKFNQQKDIFSRFNVLN